VLRLGAVYVKFYLGATNDELVAALRGGDDVLLRRQAAMQLIVVALKAPSYLQRNAPALLVPQLDLLPVSTIEGCK
jgi:hypothetical protein